MKILVVCQYYYPEPFRITDICEELVKRGHEVSVITGEPNYPEGEIYSGYENHDHMDEVLNGVHVHRCRIIPRKTGALYRFLNYYSFVLSSLAYVYSGKCRAEDGGPFDIVFVNQLSPVMMAYAGLAYKKKYNVPLVLYCLDLWPESLIAGGIKKDSAIYNIFLYISNRIYKNADKICSTSRSFSDYFKEKFDIESIFYLPQYAEDLFADNNAVVKSEITHITFAGNIGVMQSVDTILKTAALLSNEPIHFHIVGGGSELEHLRCYSEQMSLSNVTFYGRRPVEEMPYFYSQSDAMLITMKDDPGISMTLPGKVQSYMAAGKPIIGSISGETQAIIREAKCGFCVEPEDSVSLAEIIKEFSLDSNKDEYGKAARAFYSKHFSRESFFSNLESLLTS